MFRSKRMHVEQWAPFQNAFEELFMAFKGDKRLALFIENDAEERGDDGDTLLITSYQSELVERLSPGGWQDCPDATQREWGLLVGHTSAAEDHGLS